MFRIKAYITRDISFKSKNVTIHVVEPPKKALAAHLTMNPEVKAALTIQNAYRAKQARRVMRQKQGMHDQKDAINGWVTEHDKDSGYDYYVNIWSGEVTWEKPAEVAAVHKENK